MEEKEKMKQRAIQRAIKSGEKDLTQKYQNQMKLWQAVEVQAAAIMRRTLGQTGQIEKLLEPSELASLSQAIERALKGQRLIRGESTGESPQSTNNYHVAIVEILEKLERGDPDLVLDAGAVEKTEDETST